MKITHFRVRDENGTPLLGTTVTIKAQDGRTFSTGSNIENGFGIGELGAGYAEVDGIVDVLHYTGQRTTPTLPIHRLVDHPEGEMGVQLVDGFPDVPGFVSPGPLSCLEIRLPFVGA